MGCKLRTPNKGMTCNINPNDSLYFTEKIWGKAKQMPTSNQLAAKVKHIIKPSKQPR